MNRILEYARFALVSLLLVTAPACQDPPRSPAQQIAHEDVVQELQEATNAVEHFAIQLQGMEPGTPEYAAVSSQLLDAVERAAGLERELAQDDREAAETFLGGIMDTLGAFVPGAGALKPAALALGGTLLFERPRQQYLKALERLNPVGGGMSPGEAARELLAALGLLDSTEAGREARVRERKLAKARKAKDETS